MRIIFMRIVVFLHIILRVSFFACLTNEKSNFWSAKIFLGNLQDAEQLRTVTTRGRRGEVESGRGARRRS